jgi:DNA modification methylase
MPDPDTNIIRTGDCLDVLAELPENSVHAVVCDPPYGLGFMGRSWDQFDPHAYQDFSEHWSTEAKRILKPGGHLIAFSGNRTHHRLFSGVEDAGYQIRDTLTWHYGQGMPKGRDIGKAIDKERGVEREVVGTEEVDVGMQGGSLHAGREQDVVERDKTVETSPEAKAWSGWNTALKPCTEFLVLARNPVAEDTIAENVLEWGTGALNIDGNRIPGPEADGNWESVSDDHEGPVGEGTGLSGGVESEPDSDGRWPPNVIYDEAAAAQLDESVGELESGGMDMGEHTDNNEQNVYGDFSGGGERTGSFPADSGGPSRYFKTHGWDGYSLETNARLRYKYTSKASTSERTMGGRIDNPHPTVKPIDLMEWLVSLVSAEGQVVLDPFCGSGSTLKAAKGVGREFVGVEREPEWADVARCRCGLSPEDPSNVRSEEGQAGLEGFVDD